MNQKRNETEHDVLSALADAVDDAVKAEPRRITADALSPEAEEPKAKSRVGSLFSLSLDDEPEEKSAEDLAAEAAARKAAYDELAADPKLKSLDERAAEEQARLHGHRHHQSLAVETAPAAVDLPAPAPAEAAPTVEPEAVPVEKEPAREDERTSEESAPAPAAEPSLRKVAAQEAEAVQEAAAKEDEVIQEAPVQEADADAQETKAVEADAAQEVKAAEIATAQEAKAAEKATAQEVKAAEKAAAKEAKAAKKAAAREAKAAKKAAAREAKAQKAAAKEAKPRSRVGQVITSVLCILLETILLVALALYGIMFLLAKGPSGTASRLFVRSVKETSAIGFLANLYFTEDEIQALISTGGEAEYVETNTDLITMTSIPGDSAQPDAWGFVDEDGDGIILDEVKGEGYSGYMMIVLDPSRVILGCNPSMFGGRGYTVEEFVQMYDAVAGINGGAFQDENGMGSGAYPEGLVVYEGQTYNWGVKQGFAGIDDKYILHVGCQSLEDAVAANIQYGASYGPVLVQNGQMTDYDTLESGLNPRTAIGQRSDGAFLLLVIDGRQVISLGATYLDEAEIMLRYGAVNAVNLDGGSSSMMYYNGAYVNNSASVVGIRPIPTSFVVLREGRG